MRGLSGQGFECLAWCGHHVGQNCINKKHESVASWRGGEEVDAACGRGLVRRDREGGKKDMGEKLGGEMFHEDGWW